MDSKRATPWRRGSGRGILTLLANLPLGLLALIAGFLGLDDEFLAALVCRQFHAAVMSTRQREGRETSTTLIRSVVHRLRKFQWAVSTCFGAAETGHLSVLMWARFNGCGWDERVTLAAEHGGHSHVYAWAATALTAVASWAGGADARWLATGEGAGVASSRSVRVGADGNMGKAPGRGLECLKRDWGLGGREWEGG
ncbi:hypothetical protein T492DRAFT_885748 [Pavlovales sp. CCMP2436]|nr:hypothetical protein T492DRAFT_885748 [Pavlovales sp. CCMP2436]